VVRPPRRISVLGATGSVGRSTLALVEATGDAFAVEALTAFSSAAELARLARRHRARLAVVADPAVYPELQAALAGSGIEAAAGPDALVEAAERPAEWVMAAIVGAAGLAPTLAAVRRGAMVALANKECLVCAGSLFMDEVARAQAVLLPVDSEHNAVFQALAGQDRDGVEKIVLTASGGPFREAGHDTLRRVTPQSALAHPVWRMGPKISIDSATLMNKGLELIEAHWLFAVAEDRLDVVIHPQSIVHSLVCFKDGSQLAQLGVPDMRIPIAHTLGWPARLDVPTPRLDLAALGSLTFGPPDDERFPALGLARHALRTGGTAPTILSAANEVAVGAFLDGRIGFLDICEVVEAALAASASGAPLESLAHLGEVDAQARLEAERLITRVKAA
jgi:1-deoxy-D-xylulose-5-phosphate reductoisomerase